MVQASAGELSWFQLISNSQVDVDSKEGGMFLL